MFKLIKVSSHAYNHRTRTRVCFHDTSSSLIVPEVIMLLTLRVVDGFSNAFGCPMAWSTGDAPSTKPLLGRGWKAAQPVIDSRCTRPQSRLSAQVFASWTAEPRSFIATVAQETI